MARVAVIYYSSTGHVHQLAVAVAEGAEEAGADGAPAPGPGARPEEVIRAQDAWHEHYVKTQDTVEEATLDDLEWADGYAFGTPTRYGTPAAQLKQFIDTTGPLWAAGKLADKPATSFTSSQNVHGGQESTLLALNNVFYHWGAVIVAPGYTDPLLFSSGGNPYGTSYISGQDIASELPAETLAAARYQGRRLATFAARLAAAPTAA
jgi:NAD(P)H dehydrogenase (quinone)